MSSIFFAVLLPYWAVLIGFSLLKNGDVSFLHTLLVGNLFYHDPSEPFGTWFVQVLIQSLVIFSLPLLSGRIREWAGAHRMAYALIFLAVALLARIIDGYSQWGELNDLRGGQLTWVFWVFALGFLINTAEKLPAKIAVSLAVIVLPTFSYWGDPARISSLVLGGLLLIWSTRVVLPAWLISVVGTISSASLFIYLLHPRAPINSMTAEFSIDIVRILVGLALGVLGWKIYSLLLPIGLSWMKIVLQWRPNIKNK